MEEKKEVEMQMEMERMLDCHGHDMVETKVYPEPIYTHEEVARDRELFMDALRSLLSSIGAKLTVPVIGGKGLDLHLLYVEVTRRGGLEKVVRERKWREVIAEFNFPRTTTSASFVLRKNYLSLLHHFEQVYFLGAKGPLVSPSATLQTRTPQSKLNKPGSVSSGSSGQNSGAKKKRASPEPPNGGSCNFNVVGSIDGKFEYGYLVSVKIGNEMLHGVLYHVPQRQVSPYPSAMAGPMCYASPNEPTLAQTRHTRKKGWKRRDPARPKPNRSAYNFFFAETHAMLKEKYPQREREYSKMIGESWNKLTTEEKLVYHNYGVRDKERYKREMQEYKEKLKLEAGTIESASVAHSSMDLPEKE